MNCISQIRYHHHHHHHHHHQIKARWEAAVRTVSIFHCPSQAVQPAEPCFLQPAGSSGLIMLSSSLALIVSVIPIIIDKLSLYIYVCFYIFIAAKNNLWTKPETSETRTEDRLKLMQAAADPKAALGLSGDCGDPLGWGLANTIPILFVDLFGVFTMSYHVFTPPVNLTCVAEHFQMENRWYSFSG